MHLWLITGTRQDNSMVLNVDFGGFLKGIICCVYVYVTYEHVLVTVCECSLSNPTE